MHLYFIHILWISHRICHYDRYTMMPLHCLFTWTKLHWIMSYSHRADSRLAPSQWERSLQSNTVSHWLGSNLESALHSYSVPRGKHREVDTFYVLGHTKIAINILRPRQNGRHFADILKRIFTNEFFWIQIPLKFGCKFPNDNPA